MVEDGDQATALCKLYVWLRYSASRQLTWQRNYNTQPRILGEAQARLTHAIAQASRAYMLLHCRCHVATCCDTGRCCLARLYLLARSVEALRM